MDTIIYHGIHLMLLVLPQIIHVERDGVYFFHSEFGCSVHAMHVCYDHLGPSRQATLHCILKMINSPSNSNCRACEMCHADLYTKKVYCTCMSYHVQDWEEAYVVIMSGQVCVGTFLGKQRGAVVDRVSSHWHILYKRCFCLYPIDIAIKTSIYTGSLHLWSLTTSHWPKLQVQAKQSQYFIG